MGNDSSLNGFHKGKLPVHVAIIMDGNGRWAKERGSPRVEGHKAGVKRVRPLVEECRRLGIRYLTIYCFSTENWNRPKLEVSALMKLFGYYIDAETPSLKENGVRLRAIGDRERLPGGVQEHLRQAEEETKTCDKLDLILALSYGGREEIVHAVQKLVAQVAAGELDPKEITNETLAGSLYAPDVPDPDLLIRTSDEHRISNFLLWQIAYSEVVFTSVLWPDFTVEEFNRCLDEYSGRERRFGLTEDQLSKGASQ